MRVSDIVPEVLTEGVVAIWGRKKGKVVRKFRCTAGTRKGRIVAKADTCNAAKNVKSMNTLKKVRRSKGATTQQSINRRKRAGATSKRIAKANKPLSQKRYDKAVSRRKKATTSRKIPKRNVSKTATKAFKPKKVKSKRIK